MVSFLLADVGRAVWQILNRNGEQLVIIFTIEEKE
jgi:hypothetical protein